MVELYSSSIIYDFCIELCRLLSTVSFRCLKKKNLLLTDDEPANEHCEVPIVQDVLLQNKRENCLIKIE